MKILDGKEVSNKIRAELEVRAQKIKEKRGRPPHLAVLIVGEDKASQVYVKNKHLACQKVGIESSVHVLKATTPQEELDLAVRNLCLDDKIDAILVQLPLPKGLQADKILEILPAAKDADGLSFESLGYFFAGRPLVKPCTPHGVMKILEHYQIPVAGKKAVVIGRSNIVGKPMMMLLTEADATATLCHSKTKDLNAYTREADIVVVAAGKPRFFGRDNFKKDAVIIDVGIHGSGTNNGICGDVRFEELEGWASAATPVPGGVGPMTITMLLSNTCDLAERNIC